MKRVVLSLMVVFFTLSFTSQEKENKWQDPAYNPDNFTLLDGLKRRKLEKIKASGDTAALAAKKEAQAQKKVYSVFLPIIAYNPFTNVILGIGGNVSTKFGTDTTTRFSNIVPSYTYTLNKQQTLRVNSNLYSNNNNYYAFSSIMWAVAPQSTYGIGGNTKKDWQTTVEPSTMKIVFRGYKKLKENVYLGVNYNLDWKYQIEDMSAEKIQDLIAESTDPADLKDEIFESSTSGLVDYWEHENIDYTNFSNDYNTMTPSQLQNQYFYTPFGEYPYGTDSSSIASGLGVNFLYDSRDNVNSTYKGTYINMAYTYYGSWLGSTNEFHSLLIDARHHIPLTKNDRQVIAFWGMANLTFGDAPYFSLPRIGGDDWFASGRGYTAGRFLGEKLLYLETEYRVNLWKWFGMTAFVNVHTVTEENGGFMYYNPGGGLGLRARVLKSRTDINADLGFGKDGSSGIYLRFTQAF